MRIDMSERSADDILNTKKSAYNYGDIFILSDRVTAEICVIKNNKIDFSISTEESFCVGMRNNVFLFSEDGKNLICINLDNKIMSLLDRKIDPSDIISFGLFKHIDLKSIDKA